MKTIGMTLFAATALLGVACGDDSGNDGNDNDDISVVDARLPDASPDGPTPDAADVMLPEDCDYTEMNDIGNNSPADGAFETTGLTLTTEPVTVCGRINSDHFQPGSGMMLGTIDLDYFIFDLAQASNVIASMTAINSDASPALQFLVYENLMDGVEINAFYPTNGTSTYGASAGVFPAGTYIALAASIGAEAATENSSYRIKVAIDVADQCAVAAGAAQYVEAMDGAQNTGNDVISLTYNTDTFAAMPVLTPAADLPEPTGITLAVGATMKLSGISANRTLTGEYYDGDMFEFTTGPSVAQGRVQLTWPNQVADVDFVLFEKPVANGAPVVVTQAGATAPPRTPNATVPGSESVISLLKPNQGYWLWVALYESVAPLYPRAYEAQICVSGAFEP